MGTIGAPYIHQYVGDRFITPPEVITSLTQFFHSVGERVVFVAVGLNVADGYTRLHRIMQKN